MGPARHVPGGGRTPRDTGAAALEFALVAPLLLFLLFAIIGVGYGLFEIQGARATARDAARLAAVGVPDLGGYERAVVCLGERNGQRPGSLTTIALAFHPDPTATTATTAAPGKYLSVSLTYTSALDGLAFLPLTFTDDDGHITASAVTRIEQVGGSDVQTASTITVTQECS